MNAAQNAEKSSGTSVARDVRLVRAAVGVARLEDYCLLEIAGADAPNFLQNRLSNDVLALDPCQGQLTAVLDRQARTEGVFSLHRAAESPSGNGPAFFVVIEAAAKESAMAGILKYRITERVTVAEEPEKAIFSIQGPRGEDLLLKGFNHRSDAQAKSVDSNPENPLNTLREFECTDGVFFGAPGRLIRRSLSGEQGWLLLTAAEHAEPVWQCLQAEAQTLEGVVMTPEIRDLLRIEAGMPLFGHDYDTSTLLPETGLEREAVSYSKGCYLGQETVARVKTYGMVQKALVGLMFEPDANLPMADSHLLMDGHAAGVMKSHCLSPMLGRPIALAYLGKAERVPGKMLDLTIEGKPYKATVCLLPFVDNRKAYRSAQDLLIEGLRLFSEGYDNEAVRILREAIAVDSGLLEAYEALGVILSRHEQYDEAIALMERILARDPDHVLAHTNLSVFYMKKGDKERAEDEKAKATMAAFARKMKESGAGGGQVYDIEAERRKREEAVLSRIAMFEEALKFNPEDPLGNFGLGSAYLELKRYAEAVAPFERVLKAQPKHSVAYLSLGKALEATEEIERARETYQKGIETAAAKGDLMPLREMQTRLEQLK